MRKALYVSASFVIEGTRIRARLIREGVSANRNRWTRAVLEKMVPAVEGTPIHLYDFSADGSMRSLNHWEVARARLVRSLPPGLARLLPERWSEAEVGRVRNARLVVEGGVASIDADIEPHERHGSLLRAVIDTARSLGRVLGLSIHVPPDGLESRLIDGVRDILGVSRVVGFDVVSFPSAGGRILPVLEALEQRRTVMKKWLARLLRLVPEKKRGALEALIKKHPVDALENVSALVESDQHKPLVEALVAELGLADEEPALVPALLEALHRVAPESDPAPAPAPRRRAPRRAADFADPADPPPDPAGDPAVTEAIARIERQAAADRERLAAIVRQNGADLIEAVVSNQRELPEGLRTFAREHLSGILEARGEIDRATVDGFIAGLRTGLGNAHRVADPIVEARRTRFQQDYSTGERLEAAFEAMIAREPFGVIVDESGKEHRVPAFRSLKSAYIQITEDALCEGGAYYAGLGTRMPPALATIDWEQNPYFVSYRSRRGGALEATMTTASFPLLLANVMHKRMMKEYAMLAHVWRLISQTETVTDFKPRTIVQHGEFGPLALVNENSNPAGYVDLDVPTEDDLTATIAKYGGLAKITWETIVNDDLRKLRRIPGALARAAERTLNTLVWGKILNNSNIYDGTALFTGGHNNLIALAFSDVNLKLARLQATRQKDLDDQEAGRIKLRRLFVGPALIDEAVETVGAAGRAQLRETGEIGAAGSGDRALSMDNPATPNVFRTRYNFEVVEVHEFDEVAGADDNWVVAASPQEVEMVEVGFLNGAEEPSIFVQDLERVGSFFDDDVTTYKVRHVHDGGVVVDYRGFQGGIPA